MKKIMVLLLTMVMSFTLLTGCSDPLYDDFENFLNNEMSDVNENYDKLKEEVSKWEDMEEDAELESSVNDTLLPLIDDSLETLDDIKPETEEVKSLKNKYVKVMKAYREGFELVLKGLRETDEQTVLDGNEKLEKALELLDEYNEALEDLAEEVGGEIEY